MELVSVIRHKVLTEGVPIRDVARQLGLSRNTIRRYVQAQVCSGTATGQPIARHTGKGARGRGGVGHLGVASFVHGGQAAAHRNASLGVAPRRRSRRERADGTSARRVVSQRRARGHGAARLRTGGAGAKRIAKWGDRVKPHRRCAYRRPRGKRPFSSIAVALRPIRASMRAHGLARPAKR